MDVALGARGWWWYPGGMAGVDDLRGLFHEK